MVNMNRIVPVKATDLISLYGVILNQASSDTINAVLESTDVGTFSLPSATASNYLANEPVKICDVGSEVATSIYFVPAYNFEGFTRQGVPFTVVDNGVTINKDGSTLYIATLSGSNCTYTKAGL